MHQLDASNIKHLSELCDNPESLQSVQDWGMRLNNVGSSRQDPASRAEYDRVFS